MEILKGTKCSGKYISLIQDMCQGCKTVVRSADGESNSDDFIKARSYANSCSYP